MTVFVLVATALCLLDAVLLTRTLWWRRRASADAAIAAAVAVDVDAAAPVVAGTPTAPSPSHAFAGVLALFVFRVAGGGYAWLGSPDRLGLGPQSSAEAAAWRDGDSPADAAARAEAMVKINAMLDKLVAHLKEKPDDADGWQLLARTYSAMGQQPQAPDAFKSAEKLRPNDATLLADYAVALAVANNRDLEGAPMQLVERALKADPKHPKSLALAGTAAFGRKDYKGAVKYWEALAKVEPADSPISEQIRTSIVEARQLARLPPAPVMAANHASPAN